MHNSYGSTKRLKYYHASPKRLKVGTILQAPSERRSRSSALSFADINDMEVIYMTQSPIPHFTILDTSVKYNWNVYEVEPLDKVEFGHWDDATTKQAVVVKLIGSARSLVRNYKRNNQNKLQNKHEDQTKDEVLLGGVGSIVIRRSYMERSPESWALYYADSMIKQYKQGIIKETDFITTIRKIAEESKNFRKKFRKRAQKLIQPYL